MSTSDETLLQETSVILRRDEKFAERAATKIWSEKAHPDNPYIAERCRCHGYDLLELMQKRGYVDVLFLLFRGELPTAGQVELLEQLLVACINPGPRHPAVRAAMNAGIGKTDSAHILPIALTVLGGDHLGAAEVEASIRWLRKSYRQDAAQLAREIGEGLPSATVGDHHPVPGFGSRFGGIDCLHQQFATHFLTLSGAGEILRWSNEFAAALNAYKLGWLSTGLVAAVLCDLGFAPRVGPGFYQLLCAPGLYAHGIEQASKPLSAMPFPDDENYIIES